ncbi:hypothetical protein DU500_09165 [Haloplanus rubicundus]|uniref:HNH nuclease domain-containing protein n=1 Tax=Haloplanus rubicundus TaxID=1547898 RepID=A0A345E311_9EURY|nr:hypothetical protein DU500_09165 [Haloplanus rubicundus]
MERTEALLVFRGLRAYAKADGWLSDRALRLSSEFYEVAEGRLTVEEAVTTPQDRTAAALGIDWLGLVHDLPREITNSLAEALPSIEDGYRDYGVEWSAIRNEVLKRDVGRCQRCGMRDDQHREAYGAGLHVHHQEPLREFDSPDEANQFSNLMTLCASCHRTAEGE